MRKYSVLSGSIILATLGLISWGFKGHRVVATIAQHHLGSNTAYAISAFLKGQQMEEVAPGPMRTGTRRPHHGIISTSRWDCP